MATTKMEAWAVTKCMAPLEKLIWKLPAPTGTEVLIKVSHCGVCHSDLHNWEGYYDLGDGKKLRLEDRTTLPVVLGHEVLGTVQSIGPEAANMGIQEGDSRLVYPWIGCRNCKDCNNDKDDYCMQPRSMGLFQKGGFSSHIMIPHPKYLVDYGNIDPATACTFSLSSPSSACRI
jgi:alcohol dehydrogenase, propanol-preferring